MSHYQQLKFVGVVKHALPSYFSNTRVLEVGSWDRNGSVRKFFENCEYTGADVAPGPGVDLVMPGEAVDLPDGSLDVAISAECFEHNPKWRETFTNMHRMLRPGGLCLVTCAAVGRGEHGTSRIARDSSLTALKGDDDYYANLRRSDYERGFDLPRMFADHKVFYNKYFRDIYFVGIKAGGTLTRLPDIDREVALIREEGSPGLLRKAQVHVMWYGLFALASLLGERRYHDLKHAYRRRFPAYRTGAHRGA